MGLLDGGAFFSTGKLPRLLQLADSSYERLPPIDNAYALWIPRPLTGKSQNANSRTIRFFFAPEFAVPHPFRVLCGKGGIARTWIQKFHPARETKGRSPSG